MIMKPFNIAILSAVLWGVGPFVWAHEMGAAHDEKKEAASQAEGLTTVRGEVIDMACYLDHGARGEKHAQCAKTCIESGLPVGLKGDDGTTYLLIGEHKPINKEIAPYAAKTISVKGKLVKRDGMNLLENAEIVGTQGANKS
jgi:hypothetical protein